MPLIFRLSPHATPHTAFIAYATPYRYRHDAAVDTPLRVTFIVDDQHGNEWHLHYRYDINNGRFSCHYVAAAIDFATPLPR